MLTGTWKQLHYSKYLFVFAFADSVDVWGHMEILAYVSYSQKRFQVIFMFPLYFHNTVKPVFKGHLNIPEKVSIHDRCPFVTDSLTWGRYRTRSWESVPWSQGVPSSQCPLKTGFTVHVYDSLTYYELWSCTLFLKHCYDHATLQTVLVQIHTASFWKAHITYHISTCSALTIESG